MLWLVPLAVACALLGILAAYSLAAWFRVVPRPYKRGTCLIGNMTAWFVCEDVPVVVRCLWAGCLVFFLLAAYCYYVEWWG